MADPINDLNRTLGGIASDVKHILHAQQASMERTDQLEDRVRVLESFRWKMVGIATAVPAGLTAVSLYMKGAFS